MSKPTPLENCAHSLSQVPSFNSITWANISAISSPWFSARFFAQIFTRNTLRAFNEAPFISKWQFNLRVKGRHSSQESLITPTLPNWMTDMWLDRTIRFGSQTYLPLPSLQRLRLWSNGDYFITPKRCGIHLEREYNQHTDTCFESRLYFGGALQIHFELY